MFVNIIRLFITNREILGFLILFHSLTFYSRLFNKRMNTYMQEDHQKISSCEVLGNECDILF